MSDQHKNFSYSTVATAPSPATSGTSLVVATGDGAKFPTVPFNATVWPVSAQPTTANAEIVRVTAISTDTLTITRAQESSTARTVVIGDQIAATVTAKTLTDVELNVYVTDQDKTIPATTEVIFDAYLELAASFFYELSTDAILVIGDFATPLPLPDQSTNIFITVTDETVPANSEIIFSDFYELSAPFATEVAPSGLVQVGTAPDIVGSFLPGYEIGYAQITANTNITDTAEATATALIQMAPLIFDGQPVLVTFFAAAITADTAGASDTITVTLFEGGTQLARLGTVRTVVTATPVQNAVYMTYRFTPTAGLHAYKLCAFATSATGGNIVAGVAGASGFTPAFLRITKV